MTVYEGNHQISPYAPSNFSNTHNCLNSSHKPKYPEVSIIIAAYNSEKFIERCLNSALNQSFKAIEIVCVDDGSTDSTGKIIIDLSLNNKNIKLISQDNQGAASARFAGYKNSVGKYICILDSDDELEFDAIEKAYEIAELKCSDIVLFQLCRRYSNKKDRFMDLSKINWPLTGKDAFGLTIGHWRIHALGIYKREIFGKAYEEFDLTTYNADEVITRKVFLNCKRIDISKSIYYYYIHSTSTCHRMSDCYEQSIQSQLKVIDVAIRSGLYEKFKREFDSYNFKICVKADQSSRKKTANKILSEKIKELSSFISIAYVVKILLFSGKLNNRKFAFMLISDYLFGRNVK